MSKIFAATGALLLLVATFWEGREILALPGIFFLFVSIGMDIENVCTLTQKNSKMLKQIHEKLGIKEEEKK